MPVIPFPWQFPTFALSSTVKMPPLSGNTSISTLGIATGLFAKSLWTDSTWLLYSVHTGLCLTLLSVSRFYFLNFLWLYKLYSSKWKSIKQGYSAVSSCPPPPHLLLPLFLLLCSQMGAHTHTQCSHSGIGSGNGEHILSSAFVYFMCSVYSSL